MTLKFNIGNKMGTARTTRIIRELHEKERLIVKVKMLIIIITKR